VKVAGGGAQEVGGVSLVAGGGDGVEVGVDLGEDFEGVSGFLLGGYRFSGDQG